MYRDSKDRYKQGQTKASLSLQHFLGVYSGFTLDKESNTIAIICQDVTVVLAFDTRERLIQWQVKIANNLGEDEQFLVQVGGAPSRAKVGVGPARLHVRQHRFCLTVGVPPRLVGHWRISQLRKYGPVDNKFCFEGGSSCGRGEGLYVLVTDQSENISRAFKMAAEGRLNVRRRPIARNMSVMGGGSAARLSVQARLDVRMSHDDLLGCGWPSAEQGFDSRSTIADDYMQTGGGDSWSVRGSGTGEGGELERCSSCIGKLGLMSQSTSLTDGNADSWPPDYERRRVTCGSVSLASEYDRTAASSLNYWTSMSSSPPSLAVAERPRVCSVSGRPPHHCHFPSPRRTPSPSPSPSTSPSPYGNYDVPKSHCTTPCSFQRQGSFGQLRRGGFANGGGENYDTPRSVKDKLAPPPHLPAVHPHHCPPVQHHCTRVVVEDDSAHVGTCPCQRVMCWAGVGVSSWMRLPCLIAGAFQGQGHGKATTIHKVKLDGEGKMPFVNCRGENYTCKPSNGYPVRATLKEEIEEDSEDCRDPLVKKCYANVKIIVDSPSKKDSVIQTEPKPTLPYANLEFAKSLEYYENSKDLRQNKEPNKSQEEKKPPFVKENKPIGSLSCCEKCGHASRNLPPKPGPKNDDYLVMEPTVNRSTQRLQSQPCSPQHSPVHEKISQGYLPMFPISKTIETQYSRTIELTEKSQSAPTLPISVRKNIGNPSVHGLSAHNSISETNSPYPRRRLMTSASLTASDIRRELLVPSIRKRSSSMDSARYLDHLARIEEKILSPTRTLVNTPTISDASSINSLFDVSPRQRSLPTSSSEQGLSLVDRSEYVKCKSSLTLLDEEPSPQDEVGNGSLTEKIPNPSVHIKRSASIPCRTAYNRDSSGSNDSGVSTGSLRFLKREFAELDFHKPVLELKIVKEAVKFDEARLLRWKSFEPLEEPNFEFERGKPPKKSSSAGATVPVGINYTENKGYLSPCRVPYVDSHSTSSGTSDMSDYIETLSLSSYTSSDSYQLNHTALSTLRPRSGNEYHTIDRASLKPKISSSEAKAKTDDVNI